MRRRLLVILLFLLLGALVSVAVAWGCAMGPLPERQCDRLRIDASETATRWWACCVYEGTGYARYFSWVENERLAEHDELVSDRCAPRWSRVSGPLPQYDLPTRPMAFPEKHFADEDAAGWPAHALRCEIILGVSSEISPHFAIGIRYGIPVKEIYEGPLPARGAGIRLYPHTWARALPLCPIWPGFAINTILYAATLWLLMCGPFALRCHIRTHLRRKHGRCPKCNYDLRGDLAAGCPECGWNRETAQA